MVSAHHGEHRTGIVPRPQRLLDMPGHFGFALQSTVCRKLLLGAVVARQQTVGGNIGNVLLRAAPRRRDFEQMFPQLLMVAAAELSGEGSQVATAAIMPLVE